MAKKAEKRAYIDVNIPVKLKPYLKEAMEKPRIASELEMGGFSKTFSGLGNYIIREFLTENTSFRFQHLNTYENRVTVKDNKIRRVVDVYLKEGSLWCTLCESAECNHVDFVLGLSEVRKAFEKRGWQLPEPKGPC